MGMGAIAKALKLLALPLLSVIAPFVGAIEILHASFVQISPYINDLHAAAIPDNRSEVTQRS
jgi:hypothetical protein